jgi:hypothetical protein
MDEEMDEGEDHMKGMLYTIYSFILHQQRLRAQEQLAAGASSLPACRLASSPPPPPALCSPTSPVDWDRLRQPVGFHLQYNATLQRHITENLKQIFPEKKLRGFSPNFHIHVSASDLYILRIGPHIFLQAE